MNKNLKLHKNIFIVYATLNLFWVIISAYKNHFKNEAKIYPENFNQEKYSEIINKKIYSEKTFLKESGRKSDPGKIT